MLTFADPLPAAPHRILVAGVTGAGKSTLARHIAAEIGAPYTELDSLFHGTNWTKRPEFEGDVAALAAQDTWVTEYQYDSARPILLPRADVYVWLDHPYWTRTFLQVVWRTITRRLRKQELWNGNFESPLHTFFTDRDHIVRWSVRTRHLPKELTEAVIHVRPELTVVRLRGRRQVKHWLRDSLRPAQN